MKSKSDIAALFKKQRDASRKGLADQLNNTLACQAFYDGDAMQYREVVQFLDTVGKKNRAMVNFNKVQSNVDAVVGFMAQNRRQAKYIANVTDSKEQNTYSRKMNALHTYHRDNTNADQLETDQDADMMICGYGAIETDLSYLVGNATTLPNGEIIKVKLDPRTVYWDAAAVDKNLIKARWSGYYDDYDLKDALELFQDSTEDDFEKVAAVEGMDTGYVYNPYGGLYDKIKMEDSCEWSNKEENKVRVYNHQWFEYQTVYKAYNPLYLATDPLDALFIKARLDIIAGEIKQHGPEGYEVEDMFKFDPTAEEFIFDEKTKGKLVQEFGKMLEPVAFKRKCFYTAVISGKHVFSAFKSISQQGFSIKFKTGTYNASNKIWVGMVNSMMEPQKYYNKALTELMFTIAVNSKGGVMVEEDAVESIADFEGKWAKTDAVIKVRSGAISGGKIMQKTQGALPTGLENIIQLSDAAISQAGVDPAFLGAMDREDQSGILYKRRIRQIISKMARYFDSITLYQKEDARLSADLYPVWVENNVGALIMITGEDGTEEFMQVSQDMLAAEYAVTVQEAPQTPEDKQETAVLLGTMADKLAAVGNPASTTFYAESLQYMPIDGDVRNRLVESLQPQETVPLQQFQQLQAQLQELMSEQSQAMLRKTNAEAAYTEAKINTEAASQAEKLEKAANTGLENDLIRSGDYEKATVTI